MFIYPMYARLSINSNSFEKGGVAIQVSEVAVLIHYAACNCRVCRAAHQLFRCWGAYSLANIYACVDVP